jgi:four helix bundle protein
MNELELKQCTKTFALRLMKLVGALPENSVGGSIGNQLIRSGTSVGANYRAACRGRSKAVDEADESASWMELIVEGELLARKLVEPLLRKANERAAIMVASRKSAMSSIKNQKSKINNA